LANSYGTLWQAMSHNYFKGGQISLPLEKIMDEINELKNKMPEKKLFVTFNESKFEYSY